MGSRVLKRGDIVVFAAGKPRPGLIVQADGAETPIEILVCPFSTTLVHAPLYRVGIEPSTTNGLTSPPQLMGNKIGPVPRSRLGEVIERLDDPDLLRLEDVLLTTLELGI